jgi:3-dehydroquinate synthase
LGADHIPVNIAGDPRFGVDRVTSISADLQRSYEIFFADNLLETGLHALAQRIGPRRALIVTTPTVARTYGARLQAGLRSNGLLVPMLVVRCGERSKTMRQVEQICAQAYSYGLGRKSLLIGLGGGVCTDLVTMAASLLRRGIAYIRIPTTLIGQVDAAIGIKGAVNTRGKKSALGCFYAPDSIFLDPSFLRTLSPRHLSSGIAEIMKVAIVCDETLFCLLERCVPQLLRSRFGSPHEEVRTIIWRSVVTMLEELSTNLYEDRSYKRLMDFGHMFSPLLEARSGFRISHGEAVAIDMALSVAIGSQLGLLNKSVRDRVICGLAAAGLPTSSGLLTEELCLTTFREITAHRGGSLNFVMPICLGRATFIEQLEEIPAFFLRSSLAWLASRKEQRRTACRSAVEPTHSSDRASNLVELNIGNDQG